MVWRVSGGRIRDVQVSGVWLSLQLRSKFTGIIRRNPIPALLVGVGLGFLIARSTSRS